MNQELVSDDMDYPSEVSVKVSSISNIRNSSRLHLSSQSLPGVFEDEEVPEKLGKSRNPVKAPPVLQVSPRSLRGCGGS